MAGDLHLSRLTLKRSAELAPLIGVLAPTEAAEAVETGHRLVWSVMPDAVQAARRTGDDAPFLWRREDQRGRYYLLGPRPRSDSTLFDIDTRPFDIRLPAGARLSFVLRVNATVDRRSGGRDGRRERCDVAMDLLRAVPTAERAARRPDLAATAARDWLAGRAADAGFTLDAAQLDGYRAVPIRRPAGGAGRIGVFDLRGLLTVTDPDAFHARLARGFGRAKAFGCGLMLVRPAV